MTHTFNYRGQVVNVEVDFRNGTPNWLLWYEDQHSLRNEYRIVGYPNVVGNQISVTYAYCLVRTSNQQVIQSYQDTYYEKNLEAFYRMKLPADMEYGHFAGLQTINGLVARLPVFGGTKEQPEEGIRIFKADGSFYQPITFDVEIVNPHYEEGLPESVGNGEITLHPIDGVPPFQYEINAAGLQSSNTFSGLTSGLHQVRVTDSLGHYRQRSIFLKNTFNEPPAI
jgi:hypothetical protein